MVIFLYRPEYYGLDQDAEGNSTQGVGEVIIAKHRNGSLETVQLKFIGRFTKFADLDGAGGFDTSGYQPMGLPASTFDSEPSSFAPNTIRLGSKINESPVPFPKGNINKHEDPPF